MRAAALFQMTPEQRDQFFQERGVDLNKVEENTAKHRIEWQKGLEDQVFNKHMRFYDAMSLFSGDERLSFHFSDFDPTRQSDANNAREIGRRCYMIAKEMKTDNFNVALSGRPGVGKTSLGLAILDELHKAKKTTMFVSTMELVMLLDKRIEHPDVKERLNRIIDAMKRVDVLLLDDYGTEGGMKKDIRPVRKDMQDVMFSVANARLATKNGKRTKSTIITTNNTPKQLLEMYNEKLISRLIPHDAKHMVSFDGMEDAR